MIKRILSWIIISIIVLFGVSFAVLNSEKVLVNYYIDQTQIPLSLLIVIVFVAGGILGLISSVIFLVKQKHENVKLNNRIKVAEKEIKNLRSIPIKDVH